MPRPGTGRGTEQHRERECPSSACRRPAQMRTGASQEAADSCGPDSSSMVAVGVGNGLQPIMGRASIPRPTYHWQDATTIAAAAAALRAAVGPAFDIFAPGQRNMRPRGVMRRPTSPAYRDHVSEVVFGGSSPEGSHCKTGASKAQCQRQGQGQGQGQSQSSRTPSPRPCAQLQQQLQQQQQQQWRRGATPPPPPRSLSERARRRRIVGGPGVGPGLSREASPSEWRCLSAAGRSIDDIEEEAQRQAERNGHSFTVAGSHTSCGRHRSRTPDGCRVSNIVPVHFGATPTEPLPPGVGAEEWHQQRRASPRAEVGQAGASSDLINHETKHKGPGECYDVHSSWPALMPQCYVDAGDDGLGKLDGLTSRHKRLFKTQHHARTVNIMNDNQDKDLPENAEPDSSYKAMFEEHAGAPTWTVRASRPKPRSLSASLAGDDRAAAGRPTSAQQAYRTLEEVRRRGRVPAGHPAKGWGTVLEGAKAPLTTPAEVSPASSEAPRPGSPVAGDSRGLYWWSHNRSREPDYAGSDTAVPDSYPLERPPYGTVEDVPLFAKKGKRLPRPFNYAPNSVSSLKDVVFNGKERCERREPWRMSSSRSASTRVESHLGEECCIEVEDGISLRGSSTAPSLVSVIIHEAEGKVAGSYHGHIVRQEDGSSTRTGRGGGGRVVLVRRSRSSAGGSAAGFEASSPRECRSRSSVAGESFRQATEDAGKRRHSNRSCGSWRQNPNFGSSNVGDLIFCGMG